MFAPCLPPANFSELSSGRGSLRLAGVLVNYSSGLSGGGERAGVSGGAANHAMYQQGNGYIHAMPRQLYEEIYKSNTNARFQFTSGCISVGEQAEMHNVLHCALSAQQLDHLLVAFN